MQRMQGIVLSSGFSLMVSHSRGVLMRSPIRQQEQGSGWTRRTSLTRIRSPRRRRHQLCRRVRLDERQQFGQATHSIARGSGTSACRTGQFANPVFRSARSWFLTHAGSVARIQSPQDPLNYRNAHGISQHSIPCRVAYFRSVRCVAGPVVWKSLQSLTLQRRQSAHTH